MYVCTILYTCMAPAAQKLHVLYFTHTTKCGKDSSVCVCTRMCVKEGVERPACS